MTAEPDDYDDALEQAQADLAAALDYARELVRALEAATNADTRTEYRTHFEVAQEQHEELEGILARRGIDDDQLGLVPLLMSRVSLIRQEVG